MVDVESHVVFITICFLCLSLNFQYMKLWTIAKNGQQVLNIVVNFITGDLKYTRIAMNTEPFGCFLKWWYPHFTPQNHPFLVGFSPWSSWVQPTILGFTPIWRFPGTVPSWKNYAEMAHPTNRAAELKKQLFQQLVVEPTQFDIPSRKLTYPTWGKGKSSSKCNFWGDMLVSWRVQIKSSWDHFSTNWVLQKWFQETTNLSCCCKLTYSRSLLRWNLVTGMEHWYPT